MFRTFIISRLTQLSSWFGLSIIAMAFLVPPVFIALFGGFLIINNDAWFSSRLVHVRSWMERKWR